MGEHRYEWDSIDNGFNNAYAYSDRTIIIIIIITFRCIITYLFSVTKLSSSFQPYYGRI